jgi:hypothetical protein
VIKFVSDLRQVGGFLRVLRFPPPIRLFLCMVQDYKPTTIGSRPRRPLEWLDCFTLVSTTRIQRSNIKLDRIVHTLYTGNVHSTYYCGHYWYTMYVLRTLLVYNVCTVDITGIQCMYCGHYWYTLYVLWTLPVYNVCTITSNVHSTYIVYQ